MEGQAKRQFDLAFFLSGRCKQRANYDNEFEQFW